MFDFAGKRILITGGTSGIGRAVAQAFSQAGADVVAAGLEPVSDEPSIRYQYLDVTDEGSIRKLLAGLPSVDVLVNAAGIIRRDDEFHPDVFAHVVDVNLNGTMRICVAARPKLTETRGCIVNIASMLTYFGGARVPAYSASKGGIGQLTKSLALAWAAEGIRVNAVAPGWIATPLTAGLQQDETRSAQLLSRTPLARWGQPQDVAAPVLFLCSEAAAFITGAILPVDGGYSAA